MKHLLSAIAVLAFSVIGSVANAQYRSLCDSEYEGTWYFRNGARPMTISVYRVSRTAVSVTVSQRNGSETMNGTCVEGRNGARIRFSGLNSGALNVDWRGYAVGSVANFRFEGQAY